MTKQTLWTFCPEKFQFIQDSPCCALHRVTKDHGPVVQSIVSLTTSLRRQFVKYMPTILSNPLLFFVGKM